MSSIDVSNEEKVAIIAGASQGIGAGLTKVYRERGYAVIVVVTARSILTMGLSSWSDPHGAPQNERS